MSSAKSIVVVGGGIAGLAAARDVALEGGDATLVEPGPPGGKLQASPFAGTVVDEAADAFLARVPGAVELCAELGLADELVAPAAHRAYVWSHGALRPLPRAQVMGVPTDLDELAATGIVSPEGVERAGRDLATPLVAPAGDISIGELVRDRLGDEVAERLVDPLVGGINAGDTDQLSLAATVPQLDAAARSGTGSLIEACRIQLAAAADPSAPMFLTPRSGMAALAAATLEDATRRGVELVADRAVGLEHDQGGWRVVLESGRSLQADGVVIAAPAPVAAALVRPHAARAATLLAAIPYITVAMVTLAVERHQIDRELDGTGYLVPAVEGRTITACSWTTSKWPHLATGDTVILRVSVGRDGDDRVRTMDQDALVAAVVADLADTMALRGAPSEVRVTYWHEALPQYRPGHLDRLAEIEADLSAVAPGVAVTGAALRGVGVPACIRQGRAAAGRVLAALDPTR